MSNPAWCTTSPWPAHVLGSLYWAASQLELPTLSDGGHEGAGIGVHTPLKQPAGDQVLDVDNCTYNALLRGLRCLGEGGFALLTGRWRTLHHIIASPRKIGHIAVSSDFEYRGQGFFTADAYVQLVLFMLCEEIDRMTDLRAWPGRPRTYWHRETTNGVKGMVLPELDERLGEDSERVAVALALAGQVGCQRPHGAPAV